MKPWWLDKDSEIEVRRKGVDCGWEGMWSETDTKEGGDPSNGEDSLCPMCESPILEMPETIVIVYETGRQRREDGDEKVR